MPGNLQISNCHFLPHSLYGSVSRYPTQLSFSLSLSLSQNRLSGLVVRVPGYRTEMYWVFCEVRTDFIYVEESRPPLCSSGRSSWLQNGALLCFLWGTNWIYICYVKEGRPPMWSSGHSSWIQIQRSGFDFRRYQIFWVVGLERDTFSLESTIKELLERKSSGFSLESREYGRMDPSRWPRGAPYQQNVVLTSPTNSGRSVGIVRSRTKDTEICWKGEVENSGIRRKFSSFSQYCNKILLSTDMERLAVDKALQLAECVHQWSELILLQLLLLLIRDWNVSHWRASLLLVAETIQASCGTMLNIGDRIWKSQPLILLFFVTCAVFPVLLAAYNKDISYKSLVILQEWIKLFPVQKIENMAVGIRNADHVAPSIFESCRKLRRQAEVSRSV
jgi:hypothetical protein